MKNGGRREFLSFAVAATAALVGGERVAFAEPAVRVGVRVIHATKGPAPYMDPRLVVLPQLAAAPFDAFNVFRLSSEHTLELTLTRMASLLLVNHRTVSLSLLGDHGGHVDVHGHAHYRLRLEIGETGQKAYLKKLDVSATANEPFFVAGQAHDGGVLILVMTIL